MKKGQKKTGLIFIVSGPSGSGKTTLVKSVLKERGLKNKLARSISITTRPKRSGERDKNDYFFITKPEFRKLVLAKKILERTKYLGYYYATPKEYIDTQINKGKNLILCLDLKGADTLKKLYPENTIRIFIAPPSLEVLHHRIRNRCSKTRSEEVRERLRLAKEEFRASSQYDYCLINQDLALAVRQLKGILLHNINLKKEGKKCHMCH